MQEFETGAVRDTGGKGRMDLLPWSAIRRVSRHMEDACTHYPERNWEKGLPMHSMIDSAFRHLSKYMEGMDDEDHLCAAATNLLMALWTEENRPSMQDIPTRLSLGSSLHAVVSDGQGVVPSAEAQEKPKETTCNCYRSDNATCIGTKECDPVNCGGDKSKCDCYPAGRQISLEEYAEQLLGAKL